MRAHRRLLYLRLLLHPACALILVAVSVIAARAGGGEASKKDSLDRTAWFRDAKFGIFVHWGLYSRIGYTEWAQHSFEIDADDYALLRERFNPDRYDPQAWAELFEASGARYVVMTSKHHDGFSMYDTRFSDYSIMRTPYNRDVLGMLNRACLERNLRFGIYYSVMDWHHPDYLPRRYFDNRPIAGADIGRYKAFLRNHVGELIDRYDPAILWFDGGWENTLDSLESAGIVRLMLDKSPELIFNNRLSGYVFGDFQTPENVVPATGLKNADGRAALWESCSTIGDSWGFNPFTETYYSERQLIRMLVDVCSKGGNLLLNVGPAPDGTIQPEFQIRLRAMGAWLKTNGESIYGTTASVFDRLPFYGKSTSKGNAVYLHVFMFPRDGVLPVPRLSSRIRRVTLLADGRELSWSYVRNQIQIRLPAEAPDVNATVAKLELEGAPSVVSYTPEYGENDTIRLDIAGARFLPPDKAPAFTQSYNRLLIRDWSADFKDAILEWDLSLTVPQMYALSVKCAGTREQQGAITAVVLVDERSFEVTVPDRPQWTYMRKFLYTPIPAGELTLPAGKHRIRFQAPALEGKQSLTFEEVILKPQR